MCKIVYFSSIGDKVIVLKLLKKGVNPDSKDENGFTALMYACSNGFIDIVRFLIKYNVNPNILNKEKQSAIMIATKFNYIKIVSLLLKIENINLNFIDIHSNDILLYAAYNNSKEIIENITPKLTDINKIPHINKFTGFTALMIIVKNRAVGNIGCIFSLPNIDKTINQQNLYTGETALIYAAKLCFAVESLILLEKDANVNIVDFNGDTALIHACRAGCEDIVKDLLISKANPLIINCNNETARSIAAFKGYWRIVQCLDVYLAALNFNVFPPPIKDPEL